MNIAYIKEEIEIQDVRYLKKFKYKYRVHLDKKKT